MSRVLWLDFWGVGDCGMIWSATNMRDNRINKIKHYGRVEAIVKGGVVMRAESIKNLKGENRLFDLEYVKNFSINFHNIKFHGIHITFVS